jgi:hypothetical protein
MIRQVTIKDIDRILELLPLLQDPKEKHFTVHQSKPVKGVISMPFIEYSETVNKLSSLIYEIGFATDNYACDLQDADKLAKADIKAIAKCLTFHDRGERFCDGHIAVELEDGHIQAVLKRLWDIRKSFPDEPEKVVWVNKKHVG